MTTTKKRIPLASCDFACDGLVELQPARERVAPAPTVARAPGLLRDETLHQPAILAERPVLSREDAILGAAQLPEQGELAVALIASCIGLEEALTMLTGDLLERCEQLEQLLQRS